MCVHLCVKSFWKIKVLKYSLNVYYVPSPELKTEEKYARSLPQEGRNRAINAWLPCPVICMEYSSSTDEKYLNQTR